MLLRIIKSTALCLSLLTSTSSTFAGASSFSYEAKTLSIATKGSKWYYTDKHGDIDTERYSGSYYDINHTSTTKEKVRILAVRSDLLDKTKRLIDAAAEANDSIAIPSDLRLIETENDLKRIEVRENRLDLTKLLIDPTQGDLELTEEVPTTVRTLLRKTNKWQLSYVMHTKITKDESKEGGSEVVQGILYPLCRCPQELVPTVLSLIQSHKSGNAFYFHPEHLSAGKLSKMNIDKVFTPKSRRIEK